MMKRFPLVILLCALALPEAWSSGKGTAGGQFLKISVDARASAMGGAGAAMTGVQSVFYNPAGLGEVSGTEAAFTQISWIEDVHYSNLAVARRTGIGTFGLGVNYLSVPPIDKVNNRGEQLSESYTNADTAVTLSYADALPYIRHLLGGISLKLISSRLEETTASAYAVDLGLRYRLLKALELGLAAQNIGTELKYGAEGDPLPMNMKLGARYRVPFSETYDDTQGVVIAADGNMSSDAGNYVNGGLELYRRYELQDLGYALRCGYATNLDDKFNGISLGLGLNYKVYSLDYAYASFGDLGQAHRITLSVRFGRQSLVGLR